MNRHTDTNNRNMSTRDEARLGALLAGGRSITDRERRELRRLTKTAKRYARTRRAS